LVEVDRPHHDQFMIGSNALAAKNAFAEVPNDEGIGCLNACVVGHRVKVVQAHTQFGGDFS
jgi:hypothetical protein